MGTTHLVEVLENAMVTSPVLSAPVQRALPGAAATGGAVQAGGSWPALPFPSEGADQS